MLPERGENSGEKNLTGWSHLSASEEKKKKKKEGGRGLRDEAGWAGSFPGWLGRFGPRIGPSGLASSFLLLFFVL
jgi:hypothetical protein